MAVLQAESAALKDRGMAPKPLFVQIVWTEGELSKVVAVYDRHPDG